LDILKRELAPIINEVWSEIDSRAAKVLDSYLSARKAVYVDGPKGWNYTSIAEGRLDVKSDHDGVKTGVYRVKPLVEARVEFELDRWELDNHARGAKDIDLSSLEDAAKKIARFEDSVIYSGLEEAGIKGLIESCSNPAIDMGECDEEIMDAISKGMLVLQDGFAQKPYTLIVGEKAWRTINSKIKGYPLSERIKKMTGTDIVFSHAVKDALLVPYDHKDLEMTIGRDLSIGYSEHDAKKVKLFITESFTFRALSSDIVVKFNML